MAVVRDSHQLTVLTSVRPPPRPLVHVWQPRLPRLAAYSPDLGHGLIPTRPAPIHISCAMDYCAIWLACPPNCCSRSLGTRAARWAAISTLLLPTRRRCTSATLAVRGNAAPTRTPIGAQC